MTKKIEVGFRGFTGEPKLSKSGLQSDGLSAENPRDPEDRKIDEGNPVEKKDKMMDKTVADTFPASDPPSSIPDPEEDSFAA
jgi:hypothetical protein